MSSLRFFVSGIGRKILMGLSGLLLVGFLVAHLLGNLLLFRGADTFNHYSHQLISNPLIVVAELGLLALFGGHLINGLWLTIKNRRARPVGYAVRRGAGHTSRKSWASATMIVSGLVLLVFVPLHLWTFKYGPHYTSAADPAVRDLYRLVLEEFTEVGEVIWYEVAMLVIGFHLWHGFGSAFESLGVRYRVTLQRFGHLLAVVIAGGFALIPLWVFWQGSAR